MYIAHYQKKFIHIAKDESRNIAEVTEDSMGSLLPTTSEIYGLCKKKAASRERQSKDTKNIG